MVSLTSITALGVRTLMTIMFLIAGANKVTDISYFPGVNQEMAKKFICYGGWTGQPHLWQLIVGGMEIFFAIVLWLHPGIGSIALLAIMGGAVGSHLLCDEAYLAPLIPAAFLLLHLVLMRFSRSAPAKKQKHK